MKQTVTEGDLFLDAIRDKPMWRLTSNEIDALPPQERQWAINHIAYMKEEGILALVLANPKGTKYETVWEDGRWKLKPTSTMDAHEAAEAMRELVREEVDAAFARFTLKLSKPLPAEKDGTLTS